MLVLQHDKSVFLKLNTAIKGRIYAVEVGSFFNNIASSCFSVPFFSWVAVFEDNISPTVQNSTIKCSDTLIVYKKASLPVSEDNTTTFGAVMSQGLYVMLAVSLMVLHEF